MKQKGIIVFILLMLTAGLSAFQFAASHQNHLKEDTITFIVPSNFPKPLYTMHFTKSGFALGKTLFYDPTLSADGTISCGSCHQASAAFANLGSALSTGVNQCKGKRNAPPLFNMAWQKEFMWDGRINSLLEVPTNALINPCEMSNSVEKIIKYLNDVPAYRGQFKQVFGNDKISAKQLLEALGQFTGMMVSAGSKYDHVMRHELGAVFTVDQQQGYVLFQQKCSSCHREPLFTDNSYRNNGLDETYTDIGRDSITHSKGDRAKFRVPSLRNIEITSPYMHDGRFRTLKQVLIHYSSGIKNHVNLDPAFKQNKRLGIELSAIDQTDIISFLKTLTDIDFINDRRFNNN